MPQTTVSSALTKATPGLLGDAAFNDAVSCIVDLAAGIAPGLGVVRTANGDFAAALPTATFLIAAFLGVSLHSHKAKFSPSNDDNEKYEDEDTMPVLRHGRVWVRSESAFTAGAAAFRRRWWNPARRIPYGRRHRDGGRCRWPPVPHERVGGRPRAPRSEPRRLIAARTEDDEGTRP
jgi:hypothetical protein